MAFFRFKTEYTKLDPNQKQAVDHIYGPLMIIAGPGTGKTHVLTMRIANILQKADTQPQYILAITFTDAAAKEMRTRLTSLIGPQAFLVKIATFHAFCNEILEMHPEYTAFPMGSRPIEELEQIQILEELVERLPLKILKPYGNHQYFVPYIRSRIQSLKREAVSPKKFISFLRAESKKCSKKKKIHTRGAHKGKKRADMLAQEHTLEKNKELARIYAAYESHMFQNKMYDFSDMLLATLGAIKKHITLARTLRERYEFILVDEHQDTNNAQQELIELLVRGISDPNICVVGDEKQAIYRFQGGSVENFLYFKKKFPFTNICTLTKNFRSEQKILDAVHGLGTNISPQSPRLIGKKATTKNTTMTRVRVCACPSVRSELEFVAQDIRQKINEGIAPEDIAILYRDNADADEVHKTLQMHDITHTFESEQNIFKDPYVRSLLKIISAVAHIGDERKIIEALHARCFQIEPHILYQWMVELSVQGRVSIHTLDHKQVSILRELARENMNNNLSVTIERICIRTGFLASLFAEDNYYKSFRSVRTLFDVAKDIEMKNPDATCVDLLEFIERAVKHGIQISPKEDSVHGQGVRCMTTHKAKGREFGYVYIVHAYDGHWAHKQIRDPLPLLDDVFLRLYKKGSKNTAEDLTDAREYDDMRLLYVACTRAKNFLTISYPRMSFSGRAVILARTVDALDMAHVSYMSGDMYAKQTKEGERFVQAEHVYVEKEQELFFSRMCAQGLSVTSVNNFYDCAWKYVYINLLGIPRAKEKWEQYGTAIHEALRDFFTSYARKKTTKKFLIDRFVHHLKKERLNKTVYEELFQKGVQSLTSYYDTHAQGWHKTYLLEYTMRDIDAGCGVALHGKLDKVELCGEKEARVIDYKTGTPKSRNEIEGKTKNSNGGIKRQLVFYKLLLDSAPYKTYRMKTGIIEFIEQGASGKNQTKDFIIQDADVRTLKQEIQDMVDAFKNGTYETYACHKKDCEYCNLRKLITGLQS